jgi:hypothetical protein
VGGEKSGPPAQRRPDRAVARAHAEGGAALDVAQEGAVEVGVVAQRAEQRLDLGRQVEPVADIPMASLVDLHYIPRHGGRSPFTPLI